jgi:hypothetical protein
VSVAESEALGLAAHWLDQDPDHHRVTIQRSINPTKWLVRLEVGDHGHGIAEYYGKAETIHEALRGAFEAAARSSQA